MIVLALLLFWMGAYIWFFGRGPSAGGKLPSTPPFAGRRVAPTPAPNAPPAPKALTPPDAPAGDVRPIWTALDDLQLTRLLAQAAPHHPSGELT